MYRILIVEDDAGIAEAVSEQAKMWNFETHSVTNFRNVMAEFAEFDPQRGRGSDCLCNDRCRRNAAFCNCNYGG